MICWNYIHTEFSIELRFPYVIFCREVIFFKKDKYSSNREWYEDIIYSRFVFHWLWFDINYDYDFNLCSTWNIHEITFCRNHSINWKLLQDTNTTRITLRPLRWSSWSVTSPRIVLCQDDESLKHSFTVDLRSSSEMVSIINTLRSLMISSSNFTHQFDIYPCSILKYHCLCRRNRSCLIWLDYK